MWIRLSTLAVVIACTSCATQIKPSDVVRDKAGAIERALATCDARNISAEKAHVKREGEVWYVWWDGPWIMTVSSVDKRTGVAQKCETILYHSSK